ncbi:MAG TPA: ABC transporter substrate-binding protein [Stellaceae bacterium]|jgi:NitT/TauT family transport system substrate-binding protein|nr:ABC transporter substrate-binding protein [Stellaceae bacterium]
MTVLLMWGAAHAEDKIRFSYVVPTIDYTPLLVAIDKGYFTEEGIAVELVQAQGGIATPALISGDLDFSGSSSAAISAVLKGAHLKVLTTGEDRSAYQLWVKPGITSLEQLKGQQVGVISRGDTTEISLRYVLAQRHLPDDFVSYTPLGATAARVAAITTGNFAAAVIDGGESSDIDAMQKSGKLKMLINMHDSVKMVLSGFATSDALIAKNPDLIRRTMRAIYKGIATVKAQPQAAVDAMVKHGLDKGAAEFSAREFVPGMLAAGSVPRELQANELRLRGAMLGLAPDKVPPPEQVFDYSYILKAAEELKAEGWKPKL